MPSHMYCLIGLIYYSIKMSEPNIVIESLPENNNSLDISVLNALLSSLTKETHNNAKSLEEVRRAIGKWKGNDESDLETSDGLPLPSAKRSKSKHSTQVSTAPLVQPVPSTSGLSGFCSGPKLTTHVLSDNDSDNETCVDNNFNDSFLQNFLMDEHNTCSNEGETPDPTSADNFPVVGLDPDSTWDPPARALDWYKKVADIDLTDAQVDSFMESFIPPTELESHFVPPRLPRSVWDKLLHSKRGDELNRQRQVYKSQKLLYSSIMPLLTVLNSLKKSDPNQELIAMAIQMICSSNLRLSKLRRSAVSSFIKPELRQSFYEQPTTHNHLFGSDFNTSAELAIKNQSSVNKVWNSFKPKQYRTYSHSQPSSSSNSSSSNVIKSDNPSTSRPTRNEGPNESSNRASGRSFRASYRGRRPYYRSSSRGRSTTK